jgi:hypothetical protein
MTTNSKQETLHRAVVELIDLEGTIERMLSSRGLGCRNVRGDCRGAAAFGQHGRGT